MGDIVPRQGDVGWLPGDHEGFTNAMLSRGRGWVFHGGFEPPVVNARAESLAAEWDQKEESNYSGPLARAIFNEPSASSPPDPPPAPGSEPNDDEDYDWDKCESCGINPPADELGGVECWTCFGEH